MNITEQVEFATRYLSEYLHISTATLVNPVARFQPVTPESSAPDIAAPAPSSHASGTHLDPRLFGFVTISIFLGTSFNTLIPGRIEGPDMKTTGLILLVSWSVWSTLMHWYCKILRGTGKYLATLSVSLQLSAVLYVACSFATLVVSSLATYGPIQRALNDTGFVGHLVVEDPVVFYFVFQILLTMIYLPMALKKVHRFGWVRQVFLLVGPLIGFGLSILFYREFGVLGAFYQSPHPY